MPSVSSLIFTLERSSHYQEKVVSIASRNLPLIDPMDAFFLLNPSGDLSSTQVEFENWFRDQRLEVKHRTEYVNLLLYYMFYLCILVEDAH